jgi:hypothetical protein
MSRPGRALAPRTGPPVPVVQETGWTPEPVWTQRLQEISFRLCWGSNLDRPVIQPIARYYIDWATRLTLTYYRYLFKIHFSILSFIPVAFTNYNSVSYFSSPSCINMPHLPYHPSDHHNIWWYKLWNFLCNFLCPVTLSCIGANILISTMLSNAISLCFSLRVTDQISHLHNSTIHYNTSSSKLCAWIQYSRNP